MALRSLGTSLLAKNRPGTAFRDVAETEIQTPVIPGKGEAGTLSRSLIEEPIERKVPAGSDKVVTVKPTLNETSIPGDVLPQDPASDLLPGSMGRSVGFPTPSPIQSGGSFIPGQAPIPSVANSIPGVASQLAPGNRFARSSSGAGAPGAQVASGEPQVAGASTQIQVPRVESFLQGILPTAGKTLAGRAIASEGDKSKPQLNRNISQAVAGTVGSVIDKVGKAVGNPLPERGYSEKLLRSANDTSKTISGRGSLSSAFRSLTRATSPGVLNKENVKQQVKALPSYIASLFRRK